MPSPVFPFLAPTLHRFENTQASRHRLHPFHAIHWLPRMLHQPPSQNRWDQSHKARRDLATSTNVVSDVRGFTGERRKQKAAGEAKEMGNLRLLEVHRDVLHASHFDKKCIVMGVVSCTFAYFLHAFGVIRSISPVQECSASLRLGGETACSKVAWPLSAVAALTWNERNSYGIHSQILTWPLQKW